MLYYLDSNIVIYAVEGEPAFQQRARDHIAALADAGHQFAVSDLTWTECVIFPLRSNDGALLLEYQRFFATPSLTTVSISASIYRRAAMIRANQNYSLPDSLNLAVAVENRIDRFLTNDQNLQMFPDITVELLP